MDKYWGAINQNAKQIASHEAMCEERSKTIFNRLDRIDSSLDLMNKRMFSLGHDNRWYGRVNYYLAHEVVTYE